MKVEVNAPGLTTEEIKEAIEEKRRWKTEHANKPWEEIRKELLLNVIELISMEELGYASEILKFIKEKYPELLKEK